MLENLQTTEKIITEEEFFSDFSKPVEVKEFPIIQSPAPPDTIENKTIDTQSGAANTEILKSASEIKTVNDATAKTLTWVFDSVSNFICNIIAQTDESGLYSMNADEKEAFETALKGLLPKDKIFGGKYLGFAMVAGLSVANKGQKCYQQRKLNVNRISSDTRQEQNEQLEKESLEMQKALQAEYYETLRIETRKQAQDDARKLAESHKKEVKESILKVETPKKNATTRKRRGQIG